MVRHYENGSLRNLVKRHRARVTFVDEVRNAEPQLRRNFRRFTSRPFACWSSRTVPFSSPG